MQTVYTVVAEDSLGDKHILFTHQLIDLKFWIGRCEVCEDAYQVSTVQNPTVLLHPSDVGFKGDFNYWRGHELS